MFFLAASGKKAVILSLLRDHDEIPMKYQQLENLESGWKWKYLVKKHREGEPITRHLELSAAQAAVDERITVRLGTGRHASTFRPWPEAMESQGAGAG